MGELIKVEEEQLIIAKDFIEQVKEFERQKKIIEYREQKLKDELCEAMAKHNIKKWESPDGTFSVSYTPEIETTRFDTKKFEKEHLDMYFEYLTPMKRKASIRMTIKDVEE